MSDIDVLVIGGGVGNGWDLFEKHMHQQVEERAFPSLAARVKIVRAQCGDDAGLLGAARLAFEHAGLQVVPAPPREQTGPKALLVVAGLLVGFGTRLGNSCTSGHGVCGLARLAKRSITAVAVFMASAMAATFVMNHVRLSP